MKPEPYPIPYDGPVGDMLKAAGRSPMRPAHIHFMISAPGYETVTTHVFAAGDEHLDSDAVFGVKEALITAFTRHEPGPDGTQSDKPFYTVGCDFVLAPSEQRGWSLPTNDELWPLGAEDSHPVGGRRALWGPE